MLLRVGRCGPSVPTCTPRSDRFGTGARRLLASVLSARRRRPRLARIRGEAVGLRLPSRGRSRRPLRSASSAASGEACTARRSFRTRTGRCVRGFRARVSSGRSATARRCFPRSSWVVCSTTGSGGATCSLDRLHACAARLDSGPLRRLGVIKELLAQRDASYDAGGSASELHVLQRDSRGRAPASGPAVPRDRSAAGRTSSTSRGPSSGCSPSTTASLCTPERVRSPTTATGLTAVAGEDWHPIVFTDATSDRRNRRGSQRKRSRPLHQMKRSSSYSDANRPI